MPSRASGGSSWREDDVICSCDGSASLREGTTKQSARATAGNQYSQAFATQDCFTLMLIPPESVAMTDRHLCELERCVSARVKESDSDQSLTEYDQTHTGLYIIWLYNLRQAAKQQEQW